MIFRDEREGEELDPGERAARIADLRVRLLNAQFDLRQADFSVVLLVMGDDRQGCEETVDLVHEWMDARHIDTEVFLDPTDEEAQRPAYWRYWRALPRKGRIGLYLGAWARSALKERIEGGLDEAGFEDRLEEIRRFERTLADDGTLVLKFWLHAPKKQLEKRLKKARKRGLAWHAFETDRSIVEHYDEVLESGERLVRATGDVTTPWVVVASGDEDHRDLRVMEAIEGALSARLAAGSVTAPTPVVTPPSPIPGTPTLAGVDLGATVDPEEYGGELEREQTRLLNLSIEARRRGLSTVLAFEGWDAAGKGGAIRRMTRAMAARDYSVVPIAAPTEEERAHHYLWRFWRRLPRAGRMTLFDRSWYGRVLVERVEGFASQGAWQRAYGELEAFEGQLVDHGYVLLKFWLHIDPDEQLRRFQAREETPYKKYKITEDDYRNRERWDEYVAAVDEMVARTHRDRAPWHLVAANDKRHARLSVLGTVCDALERALEDESK